MFFSLEIYAKNVKFGYLNSTLGKLGLMHYDDDDEIVYFTVRWTTRASSFVYRTKNIDNNDKDSKNRKKRLGGWLVGKPMVDFVFFCSR